MSCPPQARRIEELRRDLLDRGSRLRLRAGDAAAAGAPGVAAVGHRARTRPARPSSWSTSSAAARSGVRADTTPQVARIDAHLLNRARRDAPVLLRPGAAHAARRRCTRRASRCSSAPRSTATPASRPTSRCRNWRSTCLRAAGIERPGARPGRRAHRARRAGRRAARRRRSCRTWSPALAAKDAPRCEALTRELPGRRARRRWPTLLRLYGGDEVLERRARGAARSAR